MEGVFPELRHLAHALANTSSFIPLQTFHNTIAGGLRQTSSTRHGIDPSSEIALPEVPVSTSSDVDDAVKAARAAFPAWKRLSWDEREQYLLKFADAIETNKQGFVDMLVREAGKAVTTANVEVIKAVGTFRITAKLRLHEELVKEDEMHTAILRYLPLGVGAALVPWNAPLLLCVGKVAAALLSGNCLIVKPSPFAPYCNLKLVELGIGIFPPGVLQALSGDDSLGPMLTEHPGIDKISFTGSTFTGKKVMESCSRTLKRVTLELGGNDPAIICKDADIAKAAKGVGMFAFRASGQVCMAVKRIYVHEAIYEEFKKALVDFTSTIKTGPASDPAVLVGPIQNSMQYGKVKEFYSDIEKEGWSAIVPGEKQTFSKGYFVEPTIIDNPPEGSRIVTEEPFGPIVPLLKWSSTSEVIDRANNTKMGLGASVWSEDLGEAKRIASELEAGSVWINSHFILSPDVPFGGMKWSGIGRELGVVGLKSWTEVQSMWVPK